MRFPISSATRVRSDRRSRRTCPIIPGVRRTQQGRDECRAGQSVSKADRSRKARRAYSRSDDDRAPAASSASATRARGDNRALLISHSSDIERSASSIFDRLDSDNKILYCLLLRAISKVWSTTLVICVLVRDYR